MIAELGQLCLVLAFLMSLLQAGVPLLNRLNRPYPLLHLVKPTATATMLLITAAFAALTASLYRKAGQASGAAGFGVVTFFELEAEEGRVLAAGRNDLVIVAVAEPRVNTGLLRVELLRAAESL